MKILSGIVLYLLFSGAVWSKEKEVYGQIITGSISFREVHVVNEISGKMTMLRCQRKYEIKKSIVEKVYPIFPNSFYTDELGFPENLIEDFLYFCITFKSFSRLLKKKKQTLELIQF